jgi:hypothetical protein
MYSDNGNTISQNIQNASFLELMGVTEKLKKPIMSLVGARAQW